MYVLTIFLNENMAKIKFVYSSDIVQVVYDKVVETPKCANLPI